MYTTTQQKLEKAQLLNKRHRKSIRDLNGVYLIARGRVASLTLDNQLLNKNMSLLSQHKGRVEARCSQLQDQVVNLTAELEALRAGAGTVKQAEIIQFPSAPTVN